mgnify:CR=1 FL=1
MLIRFKKNQEKIAMGLLSFMPDEKDVKKLQSTIKQYETSEDWHLYLWKEGEDIIGAIGLMTAPEDGVTIQHLSVNPSFRYQGIGSKMMKQIEEMYQGKQIHSTDSTRSFLEKCLTQED